MKFSPQLSWKTQWNRRSARLALCLTVLIFTYALYDGLSYEECQESSIDSMCSIVTNTCYVIADGLDDDGECYRKLYTRNSRDKADSIARLLKPNGDPRFYDTRLWNVDHSRLYSDYLTSMFIETLAMNRLSFKEPLSYHNFDFLFIGLGGGTLPSHVHLRLPKANITVIEVDPVVKEIAESWFDFRPDALMRCLLGDGVEYLRSETREGGAYDAIFLDACDNNQDVGLLCPVSEFVDKQVIEDMRNALKPTGVLTVNMASWDESLIDQIVNEYRKFFSTVITYNMQNKYNTVLVCLKRTLFNVSETQQMLKERLNILTAEFTLDIDNPQ